MEIGLHNVADFARGAAFLGTGGGGDPYIGRLMLQEELRRQGTIRLVEPLDLADEDLVVTCATMGAPTIMIERIPSAAATVACVEMLSRQLRRKVAAIMPIEAGGINATLPLVVAARAGFPVVDADGMGRAFPELQMVTFGIYGCSASPIVLANERGETVVIEASSNTSCERLARSLVVAMGGQAQIALYPLTGRAVREFGVLHTLTLATRIGEAIAQARRTTRSVTEVLKAFFGAEEIGRHATEIFRGKVRDISRSTRRGFAVGQAEIVSIGEDGSVCRVDFQNEFLAAFVNGRPVALVPDLVCLLDAETGEPVTTEAVRYGQRLLVFAVSVPAVMRSPAALATFGPRAFGYDFDYVPLEQLH